MKSQITAATNLVNKLIKDDNAPKWLLSAYNKLIDIYEAGDNEAINQEIKYFFHMVEANNLTAAELNNEILADNEALVVTYFTEFLKAEIGNGVVISEADFYADLNKEINLYKKELLSGGAEFEIDFMKKEIKELRLFNKTNTIKIIL